MCSLWKPKPEKVAVPIETKPATGGKPRKKKRSKSKRLKQQAPQKSTKRKAERAPDETRPAATYKAIDPRDVYRKQIEEAKLTAEKAWSEALVKYLEPKCIYNADRLAAELSRRSDSGMEHKVEICEDFVLGALSGKL